MTSQKRYKNRYDSQKRYKNRYDVTKKDTRTGMTSLFAVSRLPKLI